MKKKLSFIFCIAALVASCTYDTDFPVDQEEVSAKEGLSTDVIEISPTGSKSVITIYAAKPWRIMDIPSWVTASPASGNPGMKEIEISATLNDTHEYRKGTMSILLEDKDSNESIPLSISQPFPYLKINGEEYYEGGHDFKWFDSLSDPDVAVDLNIESNTTWSVSVDGSSISGNADSGYELGWLNIMSEGTPLAYDSSKKSLVGEGDAVLKILPAELNLGSEARSSTVKMSAPVEVSLYTSSYSVSQDNLHFSVNVGGSFHNLKDTILFDAAYPEPVSVAMSCDYDLIISVPEWLEKSSTSSSFKLNVRGDGAKANPYDQRRDGIMMVQINARDLGITPTVNIPVSQKEYILDVPSKISLGNSGASIQKVSILSSGEWELLDTPEWLNISDNAGTAGSREITFTAKSQNLDTAPRSASMTCQSKLNAITRSISVIQEQFVFDVDYKSAVEALPASTNSMEIRCSGGWEIKNCPEWVHLYQTKGTGNQIVTFSVDNNLIQTSRTAALTVVSVLNSLTQDVMLTQSAYVFDDSSVTYSGTALDPADYSLDVKCSGSWTIEGLPSWVKASMTSGKGNATVKLSMQENTTTVRREASVILISEDNPEYKKSISISQEAFSFDTKEVQLSFTSNGGKETVDIRCAGSWTASIPGNEKWISLSSNSGSGSASITITVDANNKKKSKDRSARVVITNKADGKTKNISIKQAGKK